MTSQELKNIGERICKKRKQLGYTQEKLAELMDVSIQMISNLERGNKAIKIDNLLKLSKILSISTDYILTGTQTKADIQSFSEKATLLSADDFIFIENTMNFLLSKKQS